MEGVEARECVEFEMPPSETSETSPLTVRGMEKKKRRGEEQPTSCSSLLLFLSSSKKKKEKRKRKRKREGNSLEERKEEEEERRDESEGRLPDFSILWRRDGGRDKKPS